MCAASASRGSGSAADRSSSRVPPPEITYERYPGAASAPLRGVYRRREPERSVLYGVVREHLETFLEQARRRDPDGEGYPRFVEQEFRRYSSCGILARGFARLRCPQCGYERLVAFSCKGRLCPSCVGRRMADIAAYLVDDLLPEAPYRQWVLTFPWTLRFRLAVDRALFSALLRAFLQTLFAWQRRRGRALGIAGGQTGAVTFVQRFGGALNLHPHLHCLVPDGLFVATDDDDLTFAPLPRPTTEDVEHLLTRIARRLTGVVERHCADQFQTDELLEQTVVALRDALARAVKPPVPTLDLEPPETADPKPLCAKVAGFTMHAAQAVGADDRAGLERLCRYGLRAPFSQERLTRRADGRVVYHLRRPWPNRQGVTTLVLEPHDLLRRLAALIPARYAHLVRYHGVFARRSACRARLPLPPGRREAEGDPPSGEAARTPTRPRRRPLAWAQLLRRVFSVEALRCARCSTPMVVLALLSDPPVVARILGHLGLPTELPGTAPARTSRHGGKALFETSAPDGSALVEIGDEDLDQDPQPDRSRDAGEEPWHPP